MKTTAQLRLCCLAAIFALFAFARGQAQTVPALVNYQGRLANPDGSALPTADYQLTFNLYDAATNGTLVWGPQIFDGVAAQGHGAKIPVVQGYFNVMLGPVDVNGVSLANAFGASNRFVEITVTNHAPIAPRQQILTAPFAFNSAKLAGYDWSAVFGTNDPVNGKIPNAKIGVGSISITNLAARQVGTNVGVGGLALSQTFYDNNYYTYGYGTGAVQLISVSIVSTGRPVWVGLTGGTNNTADFSGLDFYNATASTALVSLNISRNGTVLAPYRFYYNLAPTTGTEMVLPPSSVSLVDVPAAGTNIYTFSVQVSTAQASLSVRNVRLCAFEF